MMNTRREGNVGSGVLTTPGKSMWTGMFALLLACGVQVVHAQSCVAPASSIVSWWPGDSNENDIVGDNNATAAVGVTLVPAQVLDGFSFAGTDGYIEIPTSTDLQNQKFTWAAWVRPNGPGDTDDQYGSTILLQNNTDTESDVIALDWRDNPDSRFLLTFGPQITETIYSNDTFPAGSFYFVAGTYDGKTFELYVNGVLEASYALKMKIAYTKNPWGIGASFVEGVGVPFRNFNGIIDEVQAFNLPLSASRLTAIYKAGALGQCKGLLMSPSTLTFAAQAIGTSSTTQVVTARNISGVPIAIHGITASGDFEQTDTCGSSVPAGGTCTISVTFTPKASGPLTGSVKAKDSAQGSPQKIVLNGTGE